MLATLVQLECGEVSMGPGAPCLPWAPCPITGGPPAREGPSLVPSLSDLPRKPRPTIWNERQRTGPGVDQESV